MLHIISVCKDNVDGIRRTIQSTQKLREISGVYQIIIDSSNDINAAAIKEISLSGKSIEYYQQQPAGIAQAFNFGIEKSDAGHLWFLNGGDIVHPEADCELLIKIVNKTIADFIIFQLLYEESGIIPEFPPLWLHWPTIGGWIPHPSVICKKEVFNKYGNFNPRYRTSMDYDYWLRIFSKDVKVDFISFPIAVFNEDGISRNRKQVAREGLRSIMKNIFCLLKTSTIRKYLLIIILLKKIKQAL